jgi:putative sigma-54 modulation protein
MKIRIHAQHITVTEALEQHINKKFSALNPHDQDITNIEVILIVENKKAKAEAKVHVSGMDVFASSDNEDMYVAIDKLVPKLDRQLQKHKEKIHNR